LFDYKKAPTIKIMRRLRTSAPFLLFAPRTANVASQTPPPRSAIFGWADLIERTMYFTRWICSGRKNFQTKTISWQYLSLGFR